MTAKANSPKGEKLDLLVTLVEAYERKHYPLDLPNPVEAINESPPPARWRKPALADRLAPRLCITGGNNYIRTKMF